jgi:opacity protein-like surface antigen
MTTAFRALTRGLAAAAALGMSIGAAAEGSLADSIKGASSSPGKSFIGVEIGKPRYSTSCGNLAGLSCSNNGTSYSVVAGNMFTRNLGAELSYLDLGNANRAGGSVSARGVNLSLLGRLPLGESFALEGKVGGTYGVTHVSADPLAGIPTGRASGFGLGYGVGLDIHVAGGLHGNLGWEQHDFHFAGQGTSSVSNVTLGLDYTF